MPFRTLAFNPLVAFAALLALFGLAQPAVAVTYGSPAWTNYAQTLYEGPGRKYRPVGHVEGEVRVQVERCKRSWCQINDNGKRGWMFLANLNFGRQPGLPIWTHGYSYPAHGPGLVCFYTGQNFTGEAVCAEPGSKSKDLLLDGLDNAFASISVQGITSVTVCRDFDFQSYCAVIEESQPRLSRYLSKAISSYQVH